MKKYFLMAGGASVAVALGLQFGGVDDLTTDQNYCAKTPSGRLVVTKDAGKTFTHLNHTAYADKTGEGAEWLVSNNKNGPTCISSDIAAEYSLRAMPKGAQIIQPQELEGYERRSPRPGDKGPVFVPKN